MALAFKLKNNDRMVYTVIGDGEANEGTVWEAIQVADSLNLDNLTVIYDNNLSHSRGLQVRQPEKKLEAFGCDVREVDGHEVDALKEALINRSHKVNAIVANTVKGYGCPTLVESHYEWHRKSPDKELLKVLLEELNAASI
jgi:transketolase